MKDWSPWITYLNQTWINKSVVLSPCLWSQTPLNLVWFNASPSGLEFMNKEEKITTHGRFCCLDLSHILGRMENCYFWARQRYMGCGLWYYLDTYPRALNFSYQFFAELKCKNNNNKTWVRSYIVQIFSWSRGPYFLPRQGSICVRPCTIFFFSLTIFPCHLFID